MVIAFGAFQEAGQSLRFARPMFSLRRFCVNANVETKHICETNRLISWPLGQVVKTSPFHGGNMGSNPVGVTTSWGYSSAGRARALQARGHRFEPCCPHHIKKRATLCVVLFLCVGKQHRARIRRFLRLCALRAPLCPGHTARSLRNASISASLLTSPVVPRHKLHF